jgi:hypothetical protein
MTNEIELPAYRLILIQIVLDRGILYCGSGQCDLQFEFLGPLAGETLHERFFKQIWLPN